MLYIYNEYIHMNLRHIPSVHQHIGLKKKNGETLIYVAIGLDIHYLWYRDTSSVVTGINMANLGEVHPSSVVTVFIMCHLGYRDTSSIDIVLNMDFLWHRVIPLAFNVLDIQ